MDVQVPSALGDGRHADADTPASDGGTKRESRDYIADSAHLIARGRNADVYLMNDTQVLRRLHTGALTYPNIDLLRHLNSLGYPTARIIEADGTDLILERLHGPNLLQALDAGEVSLSQGVRILLDLHSSLHALPLPPIPPVTLSTDRMSGTSGTVARVPAPATPRSGTSMLHLDLHPGNVLLTADGPRVIDWESARLGSAGVDLATTALIFAEVVVDGNEYARAAQRMLRHFTREADESFRAYLTDAGAIRSTFTNIDPAERELLPDATLVVDRELRRIGR